MCYFQAFLLVFAGLVFSEAVKTYSIYSSEGLDKAISRVSSKNYYIFLAIMFIAISSGLALYFGSGICSADYQHKIYIGLSAPYLVKNFYKEISTKPVTLGSDLSWKRYL